ncbi:MAG: hypothetical protein HMLKMBBP_03363 [Planctomycetes bacterium]|nr:hypothetical protein [Planctomycetota bacterium]
MSAPTPTPAPAPAPASTDRLGTPVTPAEAEILRIYGDLKRLCERGDLPPCAARNARKALACIHVAANDLDLVYEHLYDLGV